MVVCKAPLYDNRGEKWEWMMVGERRAAGREDNREVLSLCRYKQATA